MVNYILKLDMKFMTLSSSGLWSFILFLLLIVLQLEVSHADLFDWDIFGTKGAADRLKEGAHDLTRQLEIIQHKLPDNIALASNGLRSALNNMNLGIKLDTSQEILNTALTFVNVIDQNGDKAYHTLRAFGTEVAKGAIAIGAQTNKLSNTLQSVAISYQISTTNVANSLEGGTKNLLLASKELSLAGSQLGVDATVIAVNGLDRFIYQLTTTAMKLSENTFICLIFIFLFIASHYKHSFEQILIWLIPLIGVIVYYVILTNPTNFGLAFNKDNNPLQIDKAEYDLLKKQVTKLMNIPHVDVNVFESLKDKGIRLQATVDQHTLDIANIKMELQDLQIKIQDLHIYVDHGFIPVNNEIFQLRQDIASLREDVKTRFYNLINEPLVLNGELTVKNAHVIDRLTIGTWKITNDEPNGHNGLFFDNTNNQRIIFWSRKHGFLGV